MMPMKTFVEVEDRVAVARRDWSRGQGGSVRNLSPAANQRGFESFIPRTRWAG